jgi:predicted permease
VLAEIRQAARRLLADRWTSASAILAAALGAGLNAAVFAVADGVLLRPLPYHDSSRLLLVGTDASLESTVRWRDQLTSFERVSAYSREQLTVYGGSEPQLAGVAYVDAGFFETLGTAPLEGRAPGADLTQAGVSARFAGRLGGGTPLGRPLTVGSATVTIAAAMPPAFAFPSDRIDVWVPAGAARPIAFDRSADVRRFQLIGRLKPGVSLAQARDEVRRARDVVDPDHKRDRESREIRVTPLEEAVLGPMKPVVIAFGAAALIVLLIACANVATILIGRTLSRWRELAVRRALGASPARMAASVLSESAIVSGAGAVLGVLAAIVAVRQFARWAAGVVPRAADVGIDWRTLLFAVGASAAAALLAAAPAFRAIRKGTTGLRAPMGSRSLDRRIRGALVVTQIALAVTLLAGAALLVRTIAILLSADLGVAPRGTTVTALRLTETMTFSAADRAPVLDDILRRARALPGVTSAGAGSTLPPDTAPFEVSIRLVDDRGERMFRMSAASVTPGYLPSIGASILEGRDFTDADGHRDRPAVILSQGARGLLPPGDVVGRELPLALPGPLRTRGRPIVVGVVSDIKYRGLDAQTGPAVYVVWRELPAGHTFLAVRSTRGAAALAAPLRAILREADPRAPITPARPLEDIVQETVADRRLRALLGAAVALLAVAVAMVGLAGTLMRMVLERRQELAIRAALGATPGRTIAAILREGALLAIIGVVIGIGGALAAGRVLRAFLHGVSPYDPATLGGVAAVVAAVSVAVCYLPARRASRVDPLALLRAE